MARIMGTACQLRRVGDRLKKDWEGTTISLATLGKKYGVSRQAIFHLIRRKGIKRPKREHVKECSICQALIRIAKKPHSDYISSYTIIEQLALGRTQFLYHLGILRKKGLVSMKFGTLHSRYNIPGDTLKEMLPRRLKRRDLYGEVYNELKKMILSGKLKTGQRLVEEKLAQRFDVSRQSIRTAFFQLEKDKLIIRKSRKGAFVSFGQ